jgi:hypothetical protein
VVALGDYWMVQGMGVSSFLASLQVFRAKPVTEHIFSSIKILTTNGTGNCVVVGFLVAFSVVCPLKLLPTHIAGICLRRLDVGFHVSSEVAILSKLFSRICHTRTFETIQ